MLFPPIFLLSQKSYGDPKGQVLLIELPLAQFLNLPARDEYLFLLLAALAESLTLCPSDSLGVANEN